MLGFAETVLTWEAKVVAAADAAADADTNWKHKVTPDRGDLKRCDGQTENTICRAAWSQLKFNQILQFGAVVICNNQYDEFLFFNCTKN